MAESADITATDTVVFTQYNNLRADAIDETVGHTHTGAVDDGRKVNGDVRLLHLTSGTYSGNDTADRTRTHGLPAAPKLVFIFATNTLWVIHSQQAYILHVNGNVMYDVSAITSTYFYVGNSSSYANSANAAGTTYYWYAIG